MQKEQATTEVVVNRQVKDRVFTLLFSTKEAQLELYNAMNGTSYTDYEALEVTTLEAALYMGMKNDVSFLLYNQLSFYEQQSTINPNMPLRQLFYVSEQYKKMVKRKWIYGTTLVKLPRPQFIVLYNGVRQAPEREVLRLSDAYYGTHNKENEYEQDGVGLELVTTVININSGYNKQIKTRSNLLYEYTRFVDVIHKYQKNFQIQEAVKRAIDECIEQGILREFLERERDAVMSSILYEYNEQETLAYIAEEQYGLGHKDGQEIGKEIGVGIGKEIERINLIRNNIQKQMSIESLADFMGIDNSYVKKVVDTLADMPEASDEEIAQEVMKTGD